MTDPFGELGALLRTKRPAPDAFISKMQAALDQFKA